ncbi:RDD family protein [Sulfuricurvum sp.]|uniref:RDD family protein n=1 Tax=Sulfuricurvum sp. TaxID=2025608 RepID=UPI00260D77AB|nr:RDD family protein [Sulfuricurvum sp.]MDD4883969.1 RDD family protein [Sulfuricurvum sp.]
MHVFTENEIEYAGFWIRVGATIIDTILFLMITLPILFWLYGDNYFNSDELVQGKADLILSWIFPIVGTVIFWVSRAATPGKLVLGLRVVDAYSGGYLTAPQAFGRYFAYLPAMLPLCLGLFWIGWDSKKQGWHDKLAGTVVIRKKVHTEKVKFS